MSISVQNLLSRMEEEIRLAKSSPGSTRERVYSIKVMCELIMGDSTGSEKAMAAPAQPQINLQQPAVYPKQPVFVPQQAYPQQPVSISQPKKLDEEEANGDSLFDF